MRAFGAREPDPRLRNPDYLAHHFLGGFFSTLLLLRRPSLWWYERFGPGLHIYWYTTARHKYMDQVFLDELRTGAEQVVMFGAGNDTRALRFERELAGVPTFELDLPAVMQRKRECVLRFRAELPAGLRYLGVDFEQQSVEDSLRSAGFDPRRRTLFIAEGVLPLLQPATAAGSLQSVAGAAAGSSYVFDYLRRDALETSDASSPDARFVRYFSKHVIDIPFALRAADVPEFVARNGLTLESHIDAETLAQQYLKGTDDVTRPIAGWMRIAHARVAGEHAA